MTIEEKAKAYDKALEIARKINSGEGVAAPPDWTTCEVIFPQLKESEDEKIRKEMIDFLKSEQAFRTIDLPISERWIAYLEKQKEQKPGDKAEDFFDLTESYNQGFIAGQKKMKEDIEKGFGIGEHSFEYLAGRYAGYEAGKEEQKSEEWSEEDEAMRDNILRVLSYFVGTVECDSNPSVSTSYLVYQREMNWLKSLRPQSKVEWSEKDEHWLKLCIGELRNFWKYKDELFGKKKEREDWRDGLIDFLKSLKSRSNK